MAHGKKRNIMLKITCIQDLAQTYACTKYLPRHKLNHDCITSCVISDILFTMDRKGLELKIYAYLQWPFHCCHVSK